MANRQEWLSADPIPWLLAGDDPALRYRVLVDLLDRPADDPEVRAAREAIPSSPLVAAILAAQHPNGHWAEAQSTYWPKYRATHWQLHLLAELGLPGSHPAVRRGLTCMAASITAIGAEDAAAQGEILWCYTGLVLHYLSRFGLGSTEAARRAAERMLEAARLEPGWACEHAYGRTCLWGAVKALRALAAMPAEARPAGASDVMASAARHLLEHDYAGDREGIGTTENGWEGDWLKFGFPSFYESDLLEALDALAAAGYAGEPAFGRLLELALPKQDGAGRWVLENSLNGRMHVEVEAKGEPSRWLTLRALRVLKAVP